MNTLKKPLSSCCEKIAKVNMVRNNGETRFYFCTHCGEPCDLSQRRTPFTGSTLSPTRKITGERELFVKLWAKCKGRSEVSGDPLLPPEHPMFHFQGCHLLPKGSYPSDRITEDNIAMTTVDEHLNDWPFVKECTDAQLRERGRPEWIPVVTRFRALRLKYNQRLSATIAGKG